jgi:hypothetical protein
LIKEGFSATLSFWYFRKKEHPLRSPLVLSLAVLLFMLSAPLLSAQQEEAAPIEIYSLGQQSITLSLGLHIPLFFLSFEGQGYPTNLALGAAGGLQWGIHLDNHFMVGAEIGGAFAKSELDNLLLMLPIVAKGTYIFHIFPIEIPVSLGIGMNLIKYQSQSHIDLILKPDVSPMWKYNSSWSFGLNIAYWWVFQFATGNQDADKARMGHFLSIMPTAQYNF